MNQRRNLKREGLEVYLLYLLLSYHPMFLMSGLLLLIYSLVALSFSPIIGSIFFMGANLLILVSFSYKATLYLAKIGAWIGTNQKKNGRQ